MTMYEQISNEIDANTIRLLELPQHSEEAALIRKEQVKLLTARMRLTIAEAGIYSGPTAYTRTGLPIYAR